MTNRRRAWNAVGLTACTCTVLAVSAALADQPQLQVPRGKQAPTKQAPKSTQSHLTPAPQGVRKLIPDGGFGTRGTCGTLLYQNNTPTAAFEISPADQPTQELYDRITMVSANLACQVVVVVQTADTPPASFDLTLRIYSDCPSSGQPGAAGACGTGPGVLLATATQAGLVMAPNTAMSVTFSLPNVQLPASVNLGLSCSAPGVAWQIGGNPSLGASNDDFGLCNRNDTLNGCFFFFGGNPVSNFYIELRGEPLGACCLIQCPYTCSLTTQANCDANHIFGGAGSTCASNQCGTLPMCCKGDENLDGFLDGDDIQLFVANVFTPPACGSAAYCATDVNNDTVIDSADVSAFAARLLTHSACVLTFACDDPNRCQIPQPGIGQGCSQTLAATSDRAANGGAGFWVAEDFRPSVSGSVSEICWSGVYLNFNTFTDCNATAVDNFRVAYYASDGPGGTPGTLLATFNQSDGSLGDVTRNATGGVVLFLAEFQYRATHAPVSVTAGTCVWIEVTNGLDGQCSWLWETAPPGSQRSMQDQDAVPGAQYGTAVIADYDLALCVGPTPLTVDPAACASSRTCPPTTPIAEGSFPFDTTGAPNSGSACCGASATAPDVLFAYTPTCTGLVEIDTCGSSYDTVISIHTGCPALPSNTLNCNDDCGGSPCNPLQSCMTQSVTAGTTYYIRVSGFAGASGAGILNVSCVPPIVNDNCSGAIAIGEGTQAFTTLGATTDGPDEPAQCSFFGYTQVGSDIWYCYTPTCSGNIIVSLCGSAYDTKVAVYNTDANCTCPTGPSAIACNDDFCGLQSQLTFTATAGNKYLIRIGGYADTQGTGTLTVSCAGSGPANDNCTSATAIAEGTFSFSTVVATNDGSASCGASTTSPDIWYSYTPTCTGTATVSMCGSGYDTVASAHSGCPGTTANQLACNDDSCGLQSQISFSVTAGTPYLIRVSGYNNATGTGTMTVSCGGGGGGPANDSCSSASPIGDGTVAFSTIGATTDGPDPCGVLMSLDIWYCYTASCTGTATVSLCGSTYDTSVAAYDGCTCPAGTNLACNDDFCGLQSQISFPVVSGNQYLIQVGGFNNSSGTGTMAISCGP